MCTRSIRLISIDGSFYFIQSARIVKNGKGYGYFLEVTLPNKVICTIGYGGLGPERLQKVLETIAKHAIERPDEALDLREYYTQGDACGSSYYGCTFAPRQPIKRGDAKP